MIGQMDGLNNDWTKASHQYIQNNPSNSLVIKNIILIWLVDGNLSSTKIFILNIIGR